MIGIATGVLLSMVIFHFIKLTPSNAKFKLQEEQLKGARADLIMFEEELTKAKAQIEKLKAKIKKENK
jgi:cell division protein FtsB